jgi:PRC-barrel domain protein
MEPNDTPTPEPPSDESAAEPAATPAETEPAPPVQHQDLSAWRGSDLVDRDGEKIGALEDVYFDVETDQPQFGTVKEGWLSRHLTFVPLVGVTVGPATLQVTATKEQIKAAPNIALEGDELSGEDESALYHHYQLNYTPSDTESGRRLARR